MITESIIARMFKNIGIVLKKSLSSNESSLVEGMLNVLLGNTKSIYSTNQIDFEGVEVVDYEKYGEFDKSIYNFSKKGHE